MAVAQQSLFPITATGSLSLLQRVLTAPRDLSHRAVINPYKDSTQGLACREGSGDLLRQTAFVQLPPAPRRCSALPPAPLHHLHLTHASFSPSPSKKLLLHPTQLPTSSCDNAQASNP